MGWRWGRTWDGGGLLNKTHADPPHGNIKQAFDQPEPVGNGQGPLKAYLKDSRQAESKDAEKPELKEIKLGKNDICLGCIVKGGKKNGKTRCGLHNRFFTKDKNDSKSVSKQFINKIRMHKR